MNINKNKGFTLIELLVVIAIIGILSSVLLSSLSISRAKSRDARRISDLNQIRTALFIYYDNNGNWMQGTSGCGYLGQGNGWFSYPYPGYTSMSQCLINQNIIQLPIIDPSGGLTSTAATGYSYMKYTCNLGGRLTTSLLASMETLPRGDNAAVNASCCNGCDTAYGMNYALNIQ